jgi:3-oxoacyl-[acyl-carrier protein] reductase
MTDQNQQKDLVVKPVALVTGAARGIGRAIAIELSRQGYDIAGVDIAWHEGGDTASAHDLEAEIARNGVRFLPLRGDIADLKVHHELVDSIVNRLGRIDLLVNNAGVAPLQRCDMLEMTAESYDRVLTVNLRGAFFLTQRVANWMIGARTAIPAYRPCIVFITSISATAASVNRAEYCISKSGLSMAALLYADRLSEVGIPVFEIRPGLILTDMTAPAREKYDGLIREGLVPQRRWGTPEDVAKVVASLASGPFDYSTGAVIEVSGGMNIRRL